MKGYVILVVTVSLACAFIKALIPKGKVFSQVVFVIELVMLSAILSPLFKWTGKLDFSSKDFDINQESQHTINNEDADRIYRRWFADTTADKLSKEIENKILESMGFECKVTVPWREEDGNVVFDILEIRADCSEDKCEKIEDFVSLHYSLSSRCIKGDINE